MYPLGNVAILQNLKWTLIRFRYKAKYKPTITAAARRRQVISHLPGAVVVDVIKLRWSRLI